MEKKSEEEEKEQGAPRFELGEIIVTTNFTNCIKKLGEDPNQLIRIAIGRHVTGDWGNLSDDDKASNEIAIDNKGQLLSAYKTYLGIPPFWVITEWDRSVTTVLLPEDYQMKEKQANTQQVFLSPEKLDSFKEAFNNCEGTQFEFEALDLSPDLSWPDSI